MYEQLSLFDNCAPKSDFPCNDCVFDKNGTYCSHVEDAECYCVSGSFQIRHSQLTCPTCGKQMEVSQSLFGSDGARCKCGTVKIFNNRGNRLSSLELWRQGRLIGH